MIIDESNTEINDEQLRAMDMRQKMRDVIRYLEEVYVVESCYNSEPDSDCMSCKAIDLQDRLQEFIDDID